MEVIKWRLLQLANRWCKKRDISVLYRDKVGIKTMNHPLSNNQKQIVETIIIEPEKLYLGFDAIIDEYTLLDTNILNSPHYELMRIIQSGGNILNSDYIYRCCKGILDIRQAVPPKTIKAEHYSSIFETRKKEIETGEYRHIQVYQIDDRYYIADGKHRAALCAVLGKMVCCDVISSDFLRDSYRQWIFKKMHKYDCFKKHQKLFEKL